MGHRDGRIAVHSFVIIISPSAGIVLAEGVRSGEVSRKLDQFVDSQQSKRRKVFLVAEVVHSRILD